MISVSPETQFSSLGNPPGCHVEPGFRFVVGLSQGPRDMYDWFHFLAIAGQTDTACMPKRVVHHLNIDSLTQKNPAQQHGSAQALCTALCCNRGVFNT
jgi:hypothetical protein